MQVIMSRGEYTNAIDLWSVGAVFGELLQRVSYIGTAPVPGLKVREGLQGVTMQVTSTTRGKELLFFSLPSPSRELRPRPPH